AGNLGQLEHAVPRPQVFLAEYHDDAFARADATHELLDGIAVPDLVLLAGHEYPAPLHRALDFIGEALAFTAPLVGDEYLLLDRRVTRRLGHVAPQPEGRDIDKERAQQLGRVEQLPARPALDRIAGTGEIQQLAYLERARLARGGALGAVARHELLDLDARIGTMDECQGVIDHAEQDTRIASSNPDAQHPPAV